MREHIFCAKTTSKKEWVYGDLKTISGSVLISAPSMYEGIIDSYCVEKETVSEFTGRRDKNGKRIYENNIVEEAGGHRSVVKYSEEEAKFVLESKYVVTELGNKQVPVIGNIFDNPELIDNA